MGPLAGETDVQGGAASPSDGRKSARPSGANSWEGPSAAAGSPPSAAGGEESPRRPPAAGGSVRVGSGWRCWVVREWLSWVAAGCAAVSGGSSCDRSGRCARGSGGGGDSSRGGALPSPAHSREEPCDSSHGSGAGLRADTASVGPPPPPPSGTPLPPEALASRSDAVWKEALETCAAVGLPAKVTQCAQEALVSRVFDDILRLSHSLEMKACFGKQILDPQLSLLNLIGSSSRESITVVQNKPFRRRSRRSRRSWRSGRPCMPQGRRTLQSSR